jgi:hypothetical protein
MSEQQTHLITVPLTPAEARERHVEALATEIKQPIARLLPALGFQNPLLRGGLWRVPDVRECPVCGVGVDPDRPADTPWLYGAQKITCVCGCEIGPRELLEIYADTDEKLDAVLAKISVGRTELIRSYVLELRLTAEGHKPEKYRRAAGTDVTEVLRRLEVTGESTVRGVCVDAIDRLTAETTIRSEMEIPWCPKIELDHKGGLADVGWHRAAPSGPERELARRRRVAV